VDIGTADVGTAPDAGADGNQPADVVAQVDVVDAGLPGLDVAPDASGLDVMDAGGSSTDLGSDGGNLDTSETFPFDMPTDALAVDLGTDANGLDASVSTTDAGTPPDTADVHVGADAGTDAGVDALPLDVPLDAPLDVPQDQGTDTGNDTGPSPDDGLWCNAILSSDPNNCGRCGHVCPLQAHTGAACVDGECRLFCLDTFNNCDDDINSNGCETSIINNNDHCGQCFRPCPPDRPVCVRTLCQMR
jgi:hypothetical protein